MTSQATLPGFAATGTRPPVAYHPHDGAIRDHLAERRPNLQPEALSLAAEIHAAVRDALRGEVSALGGHRSGPAWRKAVSACGRDLSVADLAHIATTPTPQTRAAARQAAVVLLRAAEPQRRASGTITSRAAEAVLAAGQLNREAVEALRDDVLDEGERRRLLELADEAQQQLDALRSIAAGGFR